MLKDNSGCSHNDMRQGFINGAFGRSMQRLLYFQQTYYLSYLWMLLHPGFIALDEQTIFRHSSRLL